MDAQERELIRSHLHQIDLLLRAIGRRTVALVERVGEVQGLIRDMEEHKKKIYEALDREGGAHPPGA